MRYISWFLRWGSIDCICRCKEIVTKAMGRLFWQVKIGRRGGLRSRFTKWDRGGSWFFTHNMLKHSWGTVRMTDSHYFCSTATEPSDTNNDKMRIRHSRPKFILLQIDNMITRGSFTHPRKWTKTDIFGVHHISCPLEKQKQRACLEDNPSPSPWETGSVSYTPQQPWFLSLFQSLESPRDIILILPTSRRMSARVPATGFVNQRKAHPSHVQDVLETRHVQHSTTTTTTTHEPFPIKISTTMPPTCVGVQSY